MDFAQDNGTPLRPHARLAQPDAGLVLPARRRHAAHDERRRQGLLRTRLHDHIFDVAETLSSMYGLFGSSTNPLVAFDVVNEVVSDGTTEADGLRRSPWYNVLGEGYIDDAFAFADEAFNDVYAADGADHPVVLVINDYNTEQSGKRGGCTASSTACLIGASLLTPSVIQFHLSLSTPVGALEGRDHRIRGPAGDPGGE